MKSQNFEFLRSEWPELAGLGGFAEAYAHSDPVGAIAKLRMYCEQVVEWIHHHQRLPKPYQANLSDLLANQPFRDVVPEVVLSKLHALRKEGNKSVHGNVGDTTSAISLTREAYNIGRWFYVTYAKGQVEDCPAFQEPTKGGVEGSEQRKEKRAILERIGAQEAQMQKLLADLETERSRVKRAEATAEERRSALEAALNAKDQLQADDPLSFNEAETRKYLIDTMLADAGWNVGKRSLNTQEVVKEAPVKYQVGPSGEGFADYVLDDDNGKPLAVIEAKKTAEDPQKGRTQAKQYADGLEKEHGQRPVIFYTNGYDLWIWNDAAGEPWRKLYGFYSKDSLQHLIFQRTEKKPVSEVSPSPAIAGRMYQIEAVRRVVEKFAEKKRKALVVQATGTGKTRVAISLSDAMIRAGWAKRVLFLCDRRELRKQANNAFKEFLPSEPRTYVTGASAGDTDHRIYLSTYRLVSARELRTGFVDLESAPVISCEDFAKLSSKGKPEKGDILFSKTGSIGHCAEIRTDEAFALTQNAARLRFKPQIEPTFALYYLRSPFIQALAQSRAKGNAVRDLQLGDMKTFPIYVPPKKEQRQFVEIARKIEDAAKRTQSAHESAKDLFNALVQRAFKGEL